MEILKEALMEIILIFSLIFNLVLVFKLKWSKTETKVANIAFKELKKL